MYDEVSRNAHNGETNAKKLITRPIMTVTSPNSPHIALTYTKMRFDNFFDQTYPPSWSKLPYVLKVGWFSCPVRKVTPKYGSTLKNLTLRIFPKLFPGGSIYVGTTSFNFHNSGEKPHRCTMCEFSSITNGQLKVHTLRNHTGEKPFKCYQCSKAYKEKGDLTKHSRIHMI